MKENTMIRLLAAAKHFNQLFLENALRKNVENRYNIRQLYELQVLQIALKTNVWISYKLRKSKSCNDVTVLLWIRRSQKKPNFLKLQSLPYE